MLLREGVWDVAINGESASSLPLSSKKSFARLAPQISQKQSKLSSNIDFTSCDSSQPLQSTPGTRGDDLIGKEQWVASGPRQARA